jgi:hypothetical protein
MPSTYDLVGSAEAAKLLEIGPTNFSHLRKKMVDANDESFPAPVIQLQCGPIWKTSDMVKFKKHYDARRRRVRGATNGDAPVVETKAKPTKAVAKAAAKPAPKRRGKAEATVTDIKAPVKKLTLAGSSKAG